MEQELIPGPNDEDTTAADEAKAPELSPWFWVILAILVSGSVGFLIGRQTAGADVVEQVSGDEAAVASTNIGIVTEDSSDVPPAAPTPASLASETITTMGDPNAPVTIVEFSDFQCPFCLRNFQETWPQLKTEYIDTGKCFTFSKTFLFLRSTLLPKEYTRLLNVPGRSAAKPHIGKRIIASSIIRGSGLINPNPTWTTTLLA